MGKQLWKIKVDIYTERRWSYQVDCFTVEKVDVLGENSERFVIDDMPFTRVDKSKSYINNELDRPCISIRKPGDILDGGIFYIMYSTKKTRPSTIKKQIQNKVNEEYSWLMNGIDLSIIK